MTSVKLINHSSSTADWNYLLIVTMVLDKAINLKRYAQSCWGLATREWHFIEPVTRGYMVRNCAFFILCEPCIPSVLRYRQAARPTPGIRPVTGYPVSVFIC